MRKSWIKRALRTFVQATVGYLAVALPTTDFTAKTALLGLGTSAIAAGIAAVMNIIDEMM